MIGRTVYSPLGAASVPPPPASEDCHLHSAETFDIPLRSGLSTDQNQGWCLSISATGAMVGDDCHGVHQILCRQPYPACL